MPVRTKNFSNEILKSNKKNKNEPLFTVEINFEKDGNIQAEKIEIYSDSNLEEIVVSFLKLHSFFIYLLLKILDIQPHLKSEL